MKKTILIIIVCLIFLATFNLTFFLLGGTERSTTEWIAYGFIHFSYLCILLLPLFVKNKPGRAVLNNSLYLRAVIYFFIELTAGLIIISINPESYFWPTIIQSVITAIFLIMQFMSLAANEATDASLTKQEREKVYIQDLAFKLRETMLNTNDEEKRKLLRSIYDTIKNASTGSNPNATDIEMQLSADVNALCMNASSFTPDQINSSIKDIKETLRKRNSIINNQA